MRSRSAGAIGTVLLFSVSLSFMSRPPLPRTGAVPGGHDVPGVFLPDDGDTMTTASVRRTVRWCNTDLCRQEKPSPRHDARYDPQPDAMMGVNDGARQLIMSGG